MKRIQVLHTLHCITLASL